MNKTQCGICSFCNFIVLHIYIGLPSHTTYAVNQASELTVPPLCFVIPWSRTGQHGLLSAFRELLLLPTKIEQDKASFILIVQFTDIISHTLVSLRVLLEFELHNPLSLKRASRDSLESTHITGVRWIVSKGFDF